VSVQVSVAKNVVSVRSTFQHFTLQLRSAHRVLTWALVTLHHRHWVLPSSEIEKIAQSNVAKF
jgi:hypothetical protein